MVHNCIFFQNGNHIWPKLFKSLKVVNVEIKKTYWIKVLSNWLFWTFYCITNQAAPYQLTTPLNKLPWLTLNKKMNEVMQESLMMISDCHSRLEKTVNELKPLYEELKKEFSKSQEVDDAKQALETSAEHLNAE